MINKNPIIKKLERSNMNSSKHQKSQGWFVCKNMGKKGKSKFHSKNQYLKSRTEGDNNFIWEITAELEVASMALIKITQ